jgi:hypothetical protein
VSERLDVLLDLVIDAGLAHELGWAAVWRILSNLRDDGRPCPYCGGPLDRWSTEPSDGAWRCAACGRLHIPITAGQATQASRARAQQSGQEAAESWRRVEARICSRREQGDGPEIAA